MSREIVIAMLLRNNVMNLVESFYEWRAQQLIEPERQLACLLSSNLIAARLIRALGAFAA